MRTPPLTSLLAMLTRVTGLAVVVGAGASMAACSGDASDSKTKSADDEIVDVPQSSLKNQSLSNCWLYATMGWAESLHTAAATGEPELNISESYLSYWHWFDQLIWDGMPGKEKITVEGFFSEGMDLMYRFGLMTEADFIPEEATSPTSRRQSTAESKLNKSLREGALKTPEARMDRALVRRELNDAWGLSPEMVAQMNAVFGEGYDRSLEQPTTVLPAGSPIRHAKSIPVMLASADGTQRRATLAEAIGAPDRDRWGHRTGALAWSEWEYPKTPDQHRAFQIRIQKALHARQPVVISWFIDFASLNGRGEFRAPPARPGRQGGHVTVLEDYQVNDVPGFGSLKAGVAETRTEALTAALNPAAKVEFFRTKNSWGSGSGPAPEFSGYLDLYTEYLNGPVKKCEPPAGGGEPVCVDEQPLWRAGLPAGF